MWSSYNKSALMVVHLLALLAAIEVVKSQESTNDIDVDFEIGLPGCWQPEEPDKTITCTNGQGGKACDKTNCLADRVDDVSCVRNRKCRCTGGYDKGDGQVVCARPYEHVCYIINDPSINPYTGPSVEVSVSCRFQLTMFESRSTDIFGQEVNCVVEVMSWGVKGRGKGRVGKHYGGGMDISITVLHAGSLYFHSTRLSGEARNGVYRFNEQVATHEDSDYGPAKPTVIPGVGDISTIYDPVNNIAEVSADMCGVRMGFRPAEFEADKSQGELAPGLYVKINKLYSPKFMGGLCLTPNTTVDDVVETTQFETKKQVSREVAMMTLALKNAVAQDFPDAPPILPALAKTAKECDLKPLVCAIENCMFVTKHPKFLKCYGMQAEDEEDYEDEDDHIDDDDDDVPERSVDGDGIGGDRESPGPRGKRNVRDTPFNPDDDGREAEEDKQLEIRRMNKSLRLMHRCIQSFCVRSASMCDLAKAKVLATECANHIPVTEQSIMSFDCQSLEPKIEPTIRPT